MGIRLHVWGERACFTRPEMKVERVSYDDAARTLRLAAALEARGFLVPPIRPPSVPDGASRLRLSLSYGHTEEQITALTATLAELVRA